jgi:hypothetical protein
LCAGAWIVLVGQSSAAQSAVPFCGAAPGSGWTAAIGDAALMIAAMMLPLVLVPVRRTACASLWRRRHRAIAGFLAGYGAIWLAAVAVEAAPFLAWPPARWAPVAAFAVAALWEASPLKRRALVLCDRTMPMRPRGWRADLDCLRYGALQGRACVMSCWPVMLAPLVVAQHVPVMAGVAALCATERYWPRRRQRLETLALAAAALCYGAAALA